MTKAAQCSYWVMLLSRQFVAVLRCSRKLHVHDWWENESRFGRCPGHRPGMETCTVPTIACAPMNLLHHEAFLAWIPECKSAFFCVHPAGSMRPWSSPFPRVLLSILSVGSRHHVFSFQPPFQLHLACMVGTEILSTPHHPHHDLIHSIGASPTSIDTFEVLCWRARASSST